MFKPLPFVAVYLRYHGMKPKPAGMKAIFMMIFFCGLLSAASVKAQEPVMPVVTDTSFTDYDFLFNELDALLDSLMTPHSFFMFNVGAGSSYLSYQTKDGYDMEGKKAMTFTPSLSYFSKAGPGLSATVLMVNDEGKANPYQVYLTASYDYLRSNSFISGLAFTHFFTRDSLAFYTSPLKNELYGYVALKKPWFRPSIAVSYGWGTRSDYQQREEYITTLRLLLNGYTRVKTEESISDLNFIASVRHDFYWMDVLGKKDYVRLTPQFIFTSGTQKFGFNQSSSTYATLPRTNTNVLFSSDRIYLDDQVYFQPLSLSAFIKTEYARGKFYLQPQLAFDYYFPATEKNLSMAFLLNAGVIF